MRLCMSAAGDYTVRLLDICFGYRIRVLIFPYETDHFDALIRVIVTLRHSRILTPSEAEFKL